MNKHSLLTFFFPHFYIDPYPLVPFQAEESKFIYVFLLWKPVSVFTHPSCPCLYVVHFYYMLLGAGSSVGTAHCFQDEGVPQIYTAVFFLFVLFPFSFLIILSIWLASLTPPDHYADIFIGLFIITQDLFPECYLLKTHHCLCKFRIVSPLCFTLCVFSLGSHP